MFKINQNDSYFWPVNCDIPKDGGGFDTQTFDGKFKRATESERKAIVDSINNGTRIGGDLQLAKELLIGWKGVADSDGSELPFSETHKDQLLEVAKVAHSVVTAWFASHAGAKTKN